MKSRLLAIGDIHGCFEPLQELIEQKIQLSKNDCLVLLGDYIDRGPRVKEVIDYIRQLMDEGYNLIPLLGNHEDMLLQAALSSDNLFLWLMNGGGKTLESFGINSPEELPDEYRSFFENLKLYWATGHYLFVHAGFNDELIDPLSDRVSLLWESRKHYRHPLLRDRLIVHGHRAITTDECDRRIRERKQVIDLDTGCVYHHMKGYGRLTALELYSGEIYTSRQS